MFDGTIATVFSVPVGKIVSPDASRGPIDETAKSAPSRSNADDISRVEPPLKLTPGTPPTAATPKSITAASAAELTPSVAIIAAPSAATYVVFMFQFPL